MANQVDEEADLEAALKSTKRAKGTHDGRLHLGAEHVVTAHEKIKKEA